ncbi:MAG: hypothetical protein ACOZF0_19290 [Thermodesulfobacteriota bacterium]
MGKTAAVMCKEKRQAIVSGLAPKGLHGQARLRVPALVADPK